MFFLSLATFGKNFDLFEFKLKEIFKKMKIIPRGGLIFWHALYIFRGASIGEYILQNLVDM